MNSTPPAWLAEYNTLRTEAAQFDLSGWSQIELRGDDRTKFLHNLCTNDIKGLATGAGCEAFLLNVQGKILFHVLVFSGPDSIILFTVPEQGQRLLAHLDRYLIREQVALHDRTGEWANLLVAGPAAPAIIERLTGAWPPMQRYASLESRLADRGVWVRHVEIVGQHDWLLNCRSDDVDAIRQAVESAGARVLGAEAFESARIETGFPLYGRDITDKNLPQEVARDDWAIHFNKGCYLGQETVARIDALGHVNWQLCGLRFDANDPPPADLELKCSDKVIGRVTSARYSPRLQASLALGYLRREHANPGSQVDSAAGSAEVISLPVG